MYVSLAMWIWNDTCGNIDRYKSYRICSRMWGIISKQEYYVQVIICVNKYVCIYIVS